MNTITRQFLICGAIAALGLFGAAAWAQNAPATPPRATAAAATAAQPAATPPAADADSDADDNDGPRPANDTSDADPPIVWTRDRARSRGMRFNDNGDGIVSVGGDSTLAAGKRTDSVVSVFGSSTSSGEVRDAVVSVFGNTRVEGGRVGDASVAVLGNNYVNAEVDGDTVAVLGDVELGPKARVRGNVVVVGGELIRDPAAEIIGNVQHVMTIPQDALVGAKSWLKNCLRYLRPLAFAPDLGWAWTIALGFLALYALFAVMFRDPLDRCVRTLQERPGETIVASLLTMLLSPVLYVVVCITIIGIAFVPILSFGMFLAALFGKAVVLAWIGRGVLKITGQNERTHSAVAVLVGGVIILLLYVVPVLGFLVFNLLGILGLGVVVYTLLLLSREKRRSSPPPASGARAPGVGPAPAAPLSGAPAGAAPYTAGFSAESMSAGRGGAAAAGSADAASAWDASAAAGGAAAASDRDAAATAGGAAAVSAWDAAATAGGGAGGGGAADAGSFAGPGPADGGIGGGTGATSPPPSNGTADALSLPRAGFWIRMLALFIDAVIVGVVFSVLDHHARLQLVALAAYGAIMWKLKGTTVGGIVCNLKIVRIDGREIDWSTAIIRALGCFLSMLVCGLGFIWIAFDPGRQAWHDKIAGTAVVRVPQGVSLL
ncbi:MAG: RDD family protein [Gammaproteobacteria bacterium]